MDFLGMPLTDLVLSEHVVVESPRSEGDDIGLLLERGDDLRVTVTLVDGCRSEGKELYNHATCNVSLPE